MFIYFILPLACPQLGGEEEDVVVDDSFNMAKGITAGKTPKEAWLISKIMPDR